MDDRIQALATEAAHQLLQNFRESHPWWTGDRTPLDELAAWLGLSIATFHPDDHPKGTYGFLEPAENLVWLCRNLPTGLHRFTLAHEIGHAILHRQVGHQYIPFLSSLPINLFDQGASREDPCQTQDIQEEVTGLIIQEQAEELLGIGLSYNPRSQRELAVNIFAAELIMPLERVRTLYLTEEIPANKLASIFDVSPSAMLNRLSGLLTAHDSVIVSAPSLPETDASNVYSRGDPRGRPVSDRPAVVRPDPSKKQYDEFQQAAIEALTPALIVAGPGSGKTSTLIGRVEYLTHTLGIAPENILALTFSRKAAEEMQERLHSILDTQATFPTVSTFHAFCAELLRTYGKLVGLRQDFAFVDDAEGYFLLLRLADELPLRYYYHLHTPTSFFPDILNGISRAKDELVPPAAYKWLALRMLEQASNDEEIERAGKALEVADIYALYQTALERQGDTDFGGLIMLTVQLLQRHPEVCQELQQKYQHILVDEFQDINRASGVLLRELAGDTRRVWVVGDANQAIYGFRGASPANIANFHNDYTGAVVLPLSRNYRSRPDIVSFADAFRSKQLEPGSEQGTVQTARATATDAYVTLAVASDETSELNGLVSDIRRKQVEGYKFRDMVVLCRTRAQARKISQALVTANLPVIERGGLLEQEHIKNLLSIVMLLADPSGMGLLRAARQPDHTLTQSDIEALLQTAREQKVPPITLVLREKVPITMSRDGCRSLSVLSNILRELNHASNVWSLLTDYLFIQTSLVRNLLAAAKDAQTQAVLADYAGLIRLARNYDQQQQALRFQQEEEALVRGEDIEPIELPDIQEQARGFLNYLTVLLTLRHDGGNRHKDSEGDDDETPDVIRVMTVHASKGLEFPVVYLPGIVKQRFPIQKRSKPVEPPTGMLPAESEGDAAHETGEACLFYVGATRARDHLVLSYAERYGKKNYKHSAYIDALLAGLPEERIRRVVWEVDDTVGTGRAGASPAPTFHVGDADVNQNVGAGASPARFTPIGDESARFTPSDENESTQSSPASTGRTWFDPISSQPSDHFIAAMTPKTLTIPILETYQRCPRQFMYGRIYGFRGEKSAYGAFWKATHDTLEALKQKLEANKGIENWDGEVLTAEETRELYSQHWREQEGHTFPFAALYERHGHEVSELIRRKLLASGDTNWQLRQNFTVDIAGKTVEVAVDRVEAPAQDGEPMKFVRTRFGKRKEKPAATTREMLYARASRQHHPERNIELHLHNMSTGETYPITLTNKKEQSLYNELEQAILGLERNEFPPKPDAFVCPTCPFFLICSA
jgi:DNA helicase II / ATP-dependent DNA helicase PcrA